MPNFEDAPDGSSSINHTGSDFSEEVRCFWEDIDPWREPGIADFAWSDFSSPGGSPVNPALPPPHSSYADGSAPAVNPLPNLNTAIVGASHIAINPNRRIEARMFSQGTAPFPANAGETVRRPQTATEVNDERMRATMPPLPRTAREMLQEASERFTTAIDTSPQVCDPPYPETAHAPRRSPRRTRRGSSDPDAAIRKDPNAWSLREAVELCKLLEVVVPEAGFHIALTGGLLYKEGRRKDCDLMFYQIRQVDPNYEILWKYLQVAGVIRSPSYPENGWLVKATYRGKAVDCLFPNAKKAKKVGAAKDDCYKAAPAPPAPHAVGEQNTAFGAQSLASNNAGTCNMEIGSALVRHNDGAPEFAAPPPIPLPPSPRCRICGLAVCGGCEVPF